MPCQSRTRESATSPASRQGANAAGTPPGRKPRTASASAPNAGIRVSMFRFEVGGRTDAAASLRRGGGGAPRRPAFRPRWARWPTGVGRKSESCESYHGTASGRCARDRGQHGGRAAGPVSAPRRDRAAPCVRRRAARPRGRPGRPRPWSRMQPRSLTASACRARCSTMSTATPRAGSWRTSSNTCRTSAGASAAVGSSRTTSFGSRQQRAGESELLALAARQGARALAQPRACSAGKASSCRAIRAGAAGTARHDVQVLQHRERGKHIGDLRHVGQSGGDPILDRQRR